MKKALVTGITGQDGSYLSEFLLDKGYDVHGIIRRSSSDHRERIAHLEGHERLHLHYGDLGDAMSLVAIIGSVLPDEIYNLAAQSHVQVSFDVPEFTADVDITGIDRRSFDEGLEEGIITYIEEYVINDYIRSTQVASMITDGEKNLKILYPPLNGTGLKPVLWALKDSGFKNVQVIPEQEQPDGDFSTCPYPNPELLDVMEYGIGQAKEFDADVIIATDPDCDRIGVVGLDSDGKYKLLNSNEVGVLMLDYICAHKTLPQNPVIMKTIVTSSMAEKVAEKYGVRTVNTLTGFKYIGEQIGKLRHDESFIFGMEESCGYLSNSHVRDKDGVNASLLLCEMAQEYKKQGLTLHDKMNSLYHKYGHYLNTQKSYNFDGIDGKDRMAVIMKRFTLSLNGFKNLQGVDVIDYLEGFRGLLPSNVREYRFSDGSRFIVRPSGTEPILKVYIETMDSDKIEAVYKQEIVIKEIERTVG